MVYSTLAAVLRNADGPYNIESVVVQDPRPDEVVVRVVAAGMCHSDSAARRPGQVLPAILGHEGAGVVEAVGSAVHDLAVDDHVIVTYDSCGVCASCQRGAPYACTTFFYLNGTIPPRSDDAEESEVFTSWFGQSSFAGYIRVRARNAVRVDQSVPLEILAPLACGIQTGAGAILNGLKPSADAKVAIVGVGAVGLAAVMAAKILGCAEILAADVNPKRLAIAQELGATQIAEIDPGASPSRWQEQLGTRTHVVDTTGIPDLIQAEIRCLDAEGKLGLISAARPLAISPRDLARRTVTLLVEGNADPQTFIPELIEYWRQGRLPIEKLIRTYALDQVNQAEADSASGETIKAVLLPRGSAGGAHEFRAA